MSRIFQTFTSLRSSLPYPCVCVFSVTKRWLRFGDILRIFLPPRHPKHTAHCGGCGRRRVPCQAMTHSRVTFSLLNITNDVMRSGCDVAAHPLRGTWGHVSHEAWMYATLQQISAALHLLSLSGNNLEITDRGKTNWAVWGHGGFLKLEGKGQLAQNSQILHYFDFDLTFLGYRGGSVLCQSRVWLMGNCWYLRPTYIRESDKHKIMTFHQRSCSQREINKQTG